jgi:hypothetical protein
MGFPLEPMSTASMSNIPVHSHYRKIILCKSMNQKATNRCLLIIPEDSKRLFEQ